MKFFGRIIPTTQRGVPISEKDAEWATQVEYITKQLKQESMCTTNEYKEYLLKPTRTSDQYSYRSCHLSYDSYRIEAKVTTKENYQTELYIEWNNTILNREEIGETKMFNTPTEANSFLAGVQQAYDSLFSKEALASRNNWHKCCCCCECKCLTKAEKEVLKDWYSKCN